MNEQKKSDSTINAYVHFNQNNSAKAGLKRKTNIMDVEDNSKQLRNNYYASLAIDDYDDNLFQKFENHVKQSENIVNTSDKNQKPKEKTISQNTAKNNDKNNAKTSNKVDNQHEKVPPINIFDVSTNQLIVFIKNCLKIDQFKIKETKQKKTLFMTSLADYAKVRAFLEKSNTKFYTFTPKSMKTKTYLLKGLDADTSTNDILAELNKYSSEHLQFIKVSPFVTKKATTEGYKLPIFMVQISPNSNVNELKSIKAILYRCVKWDQVRRPEILQCRNCQGFFHSAANCNLRARCVKCNKEHEKGKCALDLTNENNIENLYCVLCNKYGHPSSYKGCEVYKKLQQKLKEKKNKTLNSRNNYNTNINYINKNPQNINNVNPNISYADILKDNTNDTFVNNANNLPNSNLFLQEMKNLMTNMSKQIINLEKQLQMQSARIDAIFALAGINNE